jgi:glycosyltransferase involved in cell wall biosynthesis
VTARPRVLHVIPRLGRGGAGRALRALTAGVGGFDHDVLELDPPGDAAAGRAALDRADVVHVHFWNTPELYGLLTSRLPPSRLLVWSHVLGEHAPQVLTRRLREFADMTVAGTPRTGGGLRVIPPVGGWQHLDGFAPRAHAGFNVGYIGTVGPAKMHPRFVEMSARVEARDARFVVCGMGDGFAALARRAEALGVRDRFDLRGWVDDVRPVLAELDVFGYPLCEDNYSTAELVLQEAMYAGVPPVVLPFGGAAGSVDHGRTGIVARDEDDYAHAIEHLRSHPAERRRLGRAAREHALATWSPERVMGEWAGAYEELLSWPKREREWRRDPALAGAPPGAAGFVESLGDRAGAFRASLLCRDAAAEDEIAASSPVLAGADTGGILHWRRHHPTDPYLRLWSGLVLERQGRPALAAGEFAGARGSGLERAGAHA